MTHTLIPSIKGQITIPSSIRDKYKIGKSTPIIIEDKGKGIITLKIMKMVDNDEIEYYENEKEFEVHFKNGISPETLIKAIEKLDG